MNRFLPAERAPQKCPVCGAVSTADASENGVCLRCAGQRVFALMSADFNGVGPSFDPTAAEESANGGAPGAMPARIGPYEILEEIGHGGMGRVFAARHVVLGRIVALKVIAQSSSTAALELRFLREVQTIAQLRHPGIVAVHESGEADGYVYFSMDHVAGGDLAQRLRRRRYTPPEAAILIRKVALALDHAHRAGVLHRDLKPSNILLDGDEPQLADFGLAAQLEVGGDLTAHTGVLGTPHYLAPEALQRGSAALGVASDVYALGVVLFELLAGRTPFAGASPAELPTLLAGADLPSPRLLNPSVAKDLETICLTCLAPEPARRYASAGDLAEDFRRFLAGEPIKAQPPSTWYHFQKFAGRHCAWFLSAALVAATLVAATAISASLAIRARRAEKNAAGEAATARAISDFLQTDLLSQASPYAEPDREVKLRTIVDRAAKKVDGRFRDQPLVEAELRETLGNTYGALGDHAVERAHYEQALTLLKSTVGETDPRSLRVASHLASSLACFAQDQTAALELGRRTLQLTETKLGPDHPQTIRTLLDLATITQAKGDFAAAENYTQRALDTSRRVHGPDHDDTRQALVFLASVLWSERKLEQAEPLNIEAVEADRRALGADHPDTLNAMHNLASVYWAEGKLDLAEKLGLETLAIRTRVLGAEHPETLRTQNNLATTYTDAGKFNEAIALHEKTLAVRRRLLGAEAIDTLTTTMNLAVVYTKAQEFDQAEKLLAPAVEICRRTLGPEHPYTLTGTFNLADLKLRQKRYTEAEPLAEEVAAVRKRTMGAENSQTVLADEMVANIYLAEEKLPAAETLFRAVLASRVKSTPTNWRTASARYKVGLTLLRENRLAESEPLLVESAIALASASDRHEIPLASRYLVADSAARTAELYAALGKSDLASMWQSKAQSTGAASR